MLREGNVFSCVDLSMILLGVGSHVTITSDVSDLTVQSPSLYRILLPVNKTPQVSNIMPLIVASGGQDWLPVQILLPYCTDPTHASANI